MSARGLKKHSPLRAKNDVTQELQFKLHDQMYKKQIWSNCDVVTKILFKKKRANNSLNYRFAAIN